MASSEHRARNEFQDALEAWVQDPANREALRRSAADLRVALEMLVETAGAPKPERTPEWVELMSSVAVFGGAFEPGEPV